ncbi:phospholipase A2 group XV [Trichonephila clavata]|uniref:Phospholipase A2 group XV n=1 Tax=Trichonephila clavata TaxID=2740835 RepID=A0A8X6G4R8_TRICU|nr:phospholipase A2 group XV [Trichonephila clavata]
MFGFSSAYSALLVFLTVLLAINASNAGKFTLFTDQKSKKRSPVILVPGDGGNQLEVKLDKPSRVHFFCAKKTDNYYNIWLNPFLLLPFVIHCWVDNMRLIYNNETRRTTNSPGVDVRVPGFGDTSSMEWLDPQKVAIPYIQRMIYGNYYDDIVNDLVSVGYKRNVDLRGAPYDFRKAPNEMEEYYRNFKNLIEETYYKNNETKVTIICHSMGCPVTMYFLNTRPQEWKDKFIKGIVTLNGPFGGAIKAMKTIVSGENLGIFIVKPSDLIIEQRTSVSLSFMLPSPHLWKSDEVIAFTKDRNYTSNDYEEFFRDMKYSTAYEMYKDTRSHAEISLQPPGVEVYCFYGTGISTPDKLDYSNPKDFPYSPKLSFGNGDGTVNARSLEACSRWQGKQKQPVSYKAFEKVEHLLIMHHQPVRKFILDYVTTWPLDDSEQK